MKRAPRWLWQQGLLCVGLVLFLGRAAEVGAADALQTAKALSAAYAGVVEEAMPSVVGIRRIVNAKTSTSALPMPKGEGPFDHEEMLRRFFEKQRQQRMRPMEGYGSGVVIDTDGHILTNNHVIERADKLVVEFHDNTKREATVVGRDPKTDIAVIKLTEEKKGLVPARLGDSDALKVGHIVLAVGSPFRFKHTVTTGIVSGMNRYVGMTMYENFIQTDASINPGNSGGPLVNLDGEVVGINTLIHSRSGGSEGVGFAVPINMARGVMEQLVKTGTVTRGWLGVWIDDVTPDMAAVMKGVESGVAIADVDAGTPAAEGGMQRGDVIVDYNGTPPKDSRHLQKLVAATVPGTTVPVVVVRQGERVTLEVPIGKQPNDMLARMGHEDAETETLPDEAESDRLGLKVQDVNERLRRLFDLPEKDEGVVVIKVASGGPAAELGIGPGSLVLEMDQQKTPNVAAFKKVLESLEGKKTALILYRQDNHNRFGVLHLD